MATELPYPLYQGFFPQVVLTVDELMHYRRFGKERVAQLVRIIDDADCVYRWHEVKARSGRAVQRAQFLDLRPASKQPASQTPSMLLKASVHLVDVQPEEILQAVAKVKTRDARRTMSYLHGEDFVDTQTLLTFPTSSERKRPAYSYRAIKWALLKAPRRHKALDFCFLEYAGTREAQAGSSNVLGFCVQESIARDREVPTLERFNVLRGSLMRTGILVTQTHQANILKVTAVAQIDGGMTSVAARETMEELMVDYVAAVHRVKGLLERQRMGRLQYLDEWDWVASSDRKACAVCLRGFYFHRKHHCATCGEVVCSSCAPLRELDKPLDDRTHSLRVCSLCMAQAGSLGQSSLRSSGAGTESHDAALDTATSTTNVGTETYVGALRYPKHRGLRRGGVEEDIVPVRRPPASSSSSVTRTPLPPFRQPRRSVESEARSDARASSVTRRERHGSGPRGSTLSASNSSTTSSLPARAKKEALDKLVEHVRQIRDTISVALSEAEEHEERHSLALEAGGRDSGLEEHEHDRYDAVYDRILQIRETLDLSSADFDAVLASLGRDAPIRVSTSRSDALGSELAFSLSHSDGDSDSVDFVSSRSLSSGSSGSTLRSLAASLDHQDAGESLPVSTTDEDARAFEEAMRWARQSEPTASLKPTPVQPEDPEDEPTESTKPPVVTVSKNRGIERLAQKIGRLHQRLEASQRESESGANSSASTTSATATAPSVPPVVQEEEEEEEEPEPEQRAPPPALKQARGSTPSKEKHVAIVDEPETLRTPTPPRRSAHIPPDLVASLRGVMNSSELTPPPRRRPESGRLSTSTRSSSVESASASAPTTDATGAAPATIYVYDEGKLHQRQRAASRTPVAPEQGAEDDNGDAESSGYVSSEDDAHGRDERDELRGLMEGLAKDFPLRSRCSSGQSSGAPPTEKFDF